MTLLLLIAAYFSMPGTGGASSEQGQVFGVSGAVTDKSTRAPLAKVRASVQDTRLSTETDGMGKYRLNDLPPGEQYLLFEKDGYFPCLVKVRVAGDKKEITVDISLEAIHQEITVTAEAFLRTETVASSRRNLAGAEIRNIPGTFEDVSRALQVIPGVATSGDFKNDLIVRGGSPAENLFVIDRVQVPGLSHFGSQNSSGGSFGLLDAGLVQDIDFYSGGFPAYYGDKLSSITQIILREGSRSRIMGRLSLSLFGVNGSLEGPLFSARGSWIFSLRKDFFSSIPPGMTAGLRVVPDLTDGQVKLVYDLSRTWQLAVLGLAAKDRLDIEESDRPETDRMKIEINDHLSIFGLTLKGLLGEKGVAYFTLAKTDSHYSYTLNDHGRQSYQINSDEAETTAKADLEYFLLPKLQLMSGVSFKNVRAGHHIYYRGGYIHVDRMGFRFTKKSADASLDTDKLGFYLQLSYPLTRRLKATAGVRGDDLRFIDEFAFSPRIGLSYALRPGTAIHLSYGLYTQSPETLWLVSHPDNKSLRFLESEHLVFGFEHGLGKDIKVRAEVYNKAYRHYPVDSQNPYLTLANSGGSIIPSFFGSKLLSVGTGYARGFEISVQKSLTEKFSWVFDYSYSIVKYKAMDGVLRPGDFDYRHILNAVVMVKASPTWELSLRWRYTGGQPYTPFDLQLSEAKDTAYFDLTRINTLRYPAYHRLDVRVEKRFVFRRWNLDLYLDVQNLYNRKNVYFKLWEDGQQKTIYFLPIIPFIGIQAGF
jgi:hypothetical protein